MTKSKIRKLLRFAAYLAILALVLMVWAIYDSRVVPVMIFMTLGQALGTVSLVIYLAVLVADTRRRLSETGRTILESVSPPPSEEDS